MVETWGCWRWRPSWGWLSSVWGPGQSLSASCEPTDPAISPIQHRNTLVTICNGRTRRQKANQWSSDWQIGWQTEMGLRWKVHNKTIPSQRPTNCGDVAVRYYTSRQQGGPWRTSTSWPRCICYAPTWRTGYYPPRITYVRNSTGVIAWVPDPSKERYGKYN
jgi:hypothetical protein